MACCIYADHDVTQPLVRYLQDQGFDILTTKAATLRENRDCDQLLAARNMNRVLLTHNEKDFILLHHAWSLWSDAWSVGIRHAGIVIVPQSAALNLRREVADMFRDNPPHDGDLFMWKSDPSGGAWCRPHGKIWVHV